MPIKSLSYVGVVVLCAVLAAPLAAQEQPLSVIDWVQRNPDQPEITAVAMPLREPAVARSGVAPTVSVKPLEDEAVRLIGLVPPSVTGLGDDIWRGSDPAGLSDLLATLPDFRLPAAQALLYTLLLAQAQSPERSDTQGDVFTLARIAALQRFGALDPALALIEQAGGARDAAHFAAYMDLSLLSGQEWMACNFLAPQPHLAPSMAHRIFCAARRGDWATSALLFDTARALGEISKEETALLDRFLHPEFFDGLAPLRPPAGISPLLFRLHETVGEPLPTRFLPHAYAVADLRDLAGWKAQLEAAERLAGTGALPDNRLLGLYTERLPAASGGIWDRVAAIQRLDTALDTGSAEAVTKTLPAAWTAMQEGALETAFAGVFQQRLSSIALNGTAARIAETLALLAPAYATSTRRTASPLLRALALGDPTTLSSDDLFEQAVIDGFKPETARADLMAMVDQGRRGEAILRALVLLEDGGTGDARALTQALGTLRALGFEDTVRRASLQILLIERFG